MRPTSPRSRNLAELLTGLGIVPVARSKQPQPDGSHSAPSEYKLGGYNVQGGLFQMRSRPIDKSNELLRIPPFPGARMRSFVRSADGEALAPTDDEVDAILGAMAAAKVGGTFWGRQPALPIASYTLLRASHRRLLPALLEHAEDGAPLVCWLDGPEPRLLRQLLTAYLVTGSCDPWHLLAGAAKVITDSTDELALLAALAGVMVRSIGQGPFAAVAPGAAGQGSRREAFRRIAQPSRYRHPFTGQPMYALEAVELCGFWRGLIDSNRDLAAAFGFAQWKRATIEPLLWAGSDRVPFAHLVTGADAGNRVAIWRSRVPSSQINELERRGAALVEVEDGFIRSAGLGAECVPPLSIVVDRVGVHFDPSRPSELEQLLQGGDFAPELLERARDLRRVILDRGVSKYGSGERAAVQRRNDRFHILVPGQVEDDRSVQCGGGTVTSNLELLRRVRVDRPDAYILYKPHPDVEAGHRIGAIPDRTCLSFANEVVRDQPISPLLAMVDEVHVNTSLAGFEGLLRGKPVTTHGVPFYAGWGLTRDLGAVPERRAARRSLDELVAAVLLLYPRYLDPDTGLPCPPEVLVERLSNGGRGTGPGSLVKLRRLQGQWKQRLRPQGAR